MLSSLAERLRCYYFDNTTRLALPKPDTINNPNRTLHTLFRSVSQKQHLYALMVVQFFIQLLPVGSPYESCYRRFPGGGDSVALPTNSVETIISV